MYLYMCRDADNTDRKDVEEYFVLLHEIFVPKTVITYVFVVIIVFLSSTALPVLLV